MKKNDKTKRKRYAPKKEMNLEHMPSSKRKMRYFKHKRTQNRIRKTISTTHTFIKFVSVILLLWLCSRLMICSYWYLPQNIFDVYPSNHLRIIGNKITPNDKILKSLKRIPVEEKPLYLINTSIYEDEIEKLCPIKKAFVRRYWLPARFEVTIEEEIPLFTIAPSPTAPEIAALTTSGKVITKDYLPLNPSKSKTYKLLTYADYTTWTKQELASLNVLAQRIEDYSQGRLLYLDLRKEKDVYAQLEDTKIRIGELNSTLKERIERLPSIMQQIENLKNQTDYVDIRWDEVTYLKKKSKKSPNIIPPPTNAQKENNIKKNQQPKKTVKKNISVLTSKKQVQQKMDSNIAPLVPKVAPKPPVVELEKKEIVPEVPAPLPPLELYR